MPDANRSRSDGELIPPRGTIDDDEVRLEPPRLEPLTAAQEAEAAEMLAACSRLPLGAVPGDGRRQTSSE